MILTIYSFIRTELVMLLASKFCNREKPGTETLNFAGERLICEENE
jgi:hypothetical protein